MTYVGSESKKVLGGFDLRKDDHFDSASRKSVSSEKSLFQSNYNKYGEAYAVKELKKILEMDRSHVRRVWDLIVNCVPGGRGQEKSKADFIDNLRVANALSNKVGYENADLTKMQIKSMSYVLYHMDATALDSVEVMNFKGKNLFQFKGGDGLACFYFSVELLALLDDNLGTEHIDPKFINDLGERIDLLRARVTASGDVLNSKVKPEKKKTQEYTNEQMKALLAARSGAPAVQEGESYYWELSLGGSAGRREMNCQVSDHLVEDVQKVDERTWEGSFAEVSGGAETLVEASKGGFGGVKSFMHLVANASEIYGGAYRDYVPGANRRRSQEQMAVTTEVEAFLGRLAEAVTANPKQESYVVRISEMVEGSRETVDVKRSEFHGVLRLFSAHIKNPDKDLFALLSVVTRALPDECLKREGYTRV
ncbi:hypothetical protein [Pseudomonas sp. MWU13-3659]|uniref:hypothetical protein n=1 Tax=Pseudomonas sp. MWU13-3659 TaxID=2986964 RepID=UPI002074F2DC|nr:hypothetical protein [Pseudomonas sp. MWU13-3659]